MLCFWNYYIYKYCQMLKCHYVWLLWDFSLHSVSWKSKTNFALLYLQELFFNPQISFRFTPLSVLSSYKVQGKTFPPTVFVFPDQWGCLPNTHIYLTIIFVIYGMIDHIFLEVFPFFKWKKAYFFTKVTKYMYRRYICLCTVTDKQGILLKSFQFF